jgi:CheY-like chemotaxis protein
MAKILVVEDDPDLMRILIQVLKDGGHQAVLAYGGEDALRKVKLVQPDLLLTDLAMPLMTGVELIQKIRHDPQTERLPCVAVTAHIWENLAQAAQSVGCDGIVPKPFTSQRLLQEIAKHLKKPT